MPATESLLVEPRLPMAAWAAVRAPFAALEPGGARWIDAQVLQPLNELLDLAGEEMRARLFVVQGEGGRELCLRPDFTLPIARAHLASGATEGLYLYEGKAFRAAPPYGDRAGEFLQIGAEAFGPAADAARQDADIATLAWRAASAGGRHDLTMTLGDVGLFAAFIHALGLPDSLATKLIRARSLSPRALHAELHRAQAATLAPVRGGGKSAALLAGLPEAEAAGVLEELWRLAGIQPIGGRSPADIVHRLAERAQAGAAPTLSPAEADLIGRLLAVSGPPRAALDRVETLAHEARASFEPVLSGWIRRLAALVEGGVPEAALTLDCGFVRAFGYYDGMLFEVGSRALSPDQPLAAGGRYDGLLARMGGAASGEQGGAVGCVVRPGRAWEGV